MSTWGVFIDLEKAFDAVNHQILISKLYHYGIRGIANKWLSSYLSGHSQSVKLNGITSSKMNVSCGVPQGSILGPLLFLVYVNDMNLAVKSSVIHHFADDTNFLYSDKSLKKIKTSVEKDLANLYDWLCANRLSLNAGKPSLSYSGLPGKKIDLCITLKLHHTKLDLYLTTS